MTEYKACPASWDQVKKWNETGSESSSCLLELLSRVEALEAAQRPNVRPELQNPPKGTRLLSYRVENYALRAAQAEPTSAHSYIGWILFEADGKLRPEAREVLAAFGIIQPDDISPEPS
jgi:hypothetical protein